MTTFTFQKAVKAQEKLRLALDGPPGGGKTYTALLVGCWLAGHQAKGQGNGRVAVVDSERSSSKKYAGMFDFDQLTIPDSDPHTYIEAIKAAQAAGYSVLIIDSLSHAWEGTLDLKDAVVKRSKNKDGFGAWREVTPVHNELVDVMLRFPGHVIATMRTKMEYLVDKNEETGKTKVSKVGLKPVQRDGVDYEFDVVGDMDEENTLTITKSRCFELSGQVIRKPDTDLAKVLYEWLQDGEPLVSDEQAQAIRDVFSVVTDDQVRVTAQRTFAASFGKPKDVTASQFQEAFAFAEEVCGVSFRPLADADDTGFDAAPTEVPAEGSEQIVNEAVEPGPTPESLLQDLELAIKGLPRAAQPHCRTELNKTFGNLSACSVEELHGAIEIVKGWPIGEPIPMTKEAPLSAKQRGVLAYAHGHGIDTAQVSALGALARGTKEPRPLHELDDVDCQAVTALIDMVKSGEVVFEQPNGVLIAKETVS